MSSDSDILREDILIPQSRCYHFGINLFWKTNGTCGASAPGRRSSPWSTDKAVLLYMSAAAMQGMVMRLLLVRQENLSEEMERAVLRFSWTTVCMLCAHTVLPECDKTKALQGDARICQDSLHSSQRYVSATNPYPSHNTGGIQISNQSIPITQKGGIQISNQSIPITQNRWDSNQ